MHRYIYMYVYIYIHHIYYIQTHRIPHKSEATAAVPAMGCNWSRFILSFMDLVITGMVRILKHVYMDAHICSRLKSATQPWDRVRFLPR
jgi:hypothetical protein